MIIMLLKRYFNSELDEVKEEHIEKALIQNMIREDYEKLLHDKGLYEPDSAKRIGKSEPVHLWAIWRNRPQWAAAASVLLVVGFTWLFWHKPTNQNDSASSLNDLVNNGLGQEKAAYFALPNTRLGVNNQTSTDWSAFKQAYNKGKFEAASGYLTAIYTRQQASDTTLFYLALCKLYQTAPDYNAATQHFNEVITTQQAYQVESNWFLALICLKKGEKAKGIAQLRHFIH